MFTEQDLELAKACVDEYLAQVDHMAVTPLHVFIAKYIAHAREQCHLGNSSEPSAYFPRKNA